MANLKILVVEDRPLTAEDIKYSLEEMGYEVVAVAHSGGAALEHLEKIKPDLVMLDIDLGEGMNGISVGRIIQQSYQVPFIYLTARSDKETLVEAKATGPAAYITKPFKAQDLRAAIEIAMYNLESGQEASYQQERPSQETPIASGYGALFVKHKGRYEKIFQDDILWVEAEDTYARIATPERNYLVSFTLKAVSERLTSPDLIRVHRSHVANIKRVEAIEDNMLIIGKKVIPVSKSYRETVMKHFDLL